MQVPNFKTFVLSQQAVIRNSEGKVLVLRSTEHGKLLLPGGRVDEGETDLEAALRRELKEEMNVEKVKILHPLGTDNSPKITTFAVAFLCEVEDMENFKLSPEHTEFKWIDKSELEESLIYKKLGREINQNLI